MTSQNGQAHFKNLQHLLQEFKVWPLREVLYYVR